jgi:hypothetical protein
MRALVPAGAKPHEARPACGWPGRASFVEKVGWPIPPSTEEVGVVAGSVALNQNELDQDSIHEEGPLVREMLLVDFSQRPSPDEVIDSIEVIRRKQQIDVVMGARRRKPAELLCPASEQPHGDALMRKHLDEVTDEGRIVHPVATVADLCW